MAIAARGMVVAASPMVLALLRAAVQAVLVRLSAAAWMAAAVESELDAAVSVEAARLAAVWATATPMAAAMRTPPWPEGKRRAPARAVPASQGAWRAAAAWHSPPGRCPTR